MFYQPEDGHGLPHDPWKACVAPRPIGWVSTVSPDGGVNLAPYSYFMACADRPPMVLFCPGIDQGRPGAPATGHKDSRVNAEATGEFVISMATHDQREGMNLSAGRHPPGVDEFQVAGLAPMPSKLVRPPRVAGAPVHMECRTVKVVDLPAERAGDAYCLVIGQVIGIHIEDWALTDGKLDLARIRPIARLGYREYAVVDQVFEMTRPAVPATATS